MRSSNPQYAQLNMWVNSRLKMTVLLSHYSPLSVSQWRQNTWTTSPTCSHQVPPLRCRHPSSSSSFSPFRLYYHPFIRNHIICSSWCFSVSGKNVNFFYFWLQLKPFPYLNLDHSIRTLDREPECMMSQKVTSCDVFDRIPQISEQFYNFLRKLNLQHLVWPQCPPS